MKTTTEKFNGINRLVRLSLGVIFIALLVTLMPCRSRDYLDALGSARKPLVLIQGQTQPIPSADYLLSPGGASLNNNAASAGGLEATTINGVVYADALTDVGIQAAIDAAPLGGEVHLRSGKTYVLNAGLPIIVTKSIVIDCEGWGTILQVAASVGGTKNVFLIRPSGDVQGVTFRNCNIVPQSGTPAKSGFMIDGTTNALGYLVLDHVAVGQLGSFGFAIQNASALVQGTPYDSLITNASIITGGLNLTDVGDSFLINNATEIGGTGSIIVKVAHPEGSDGGAHGFVIDSANITVSGGVVIQAAPQGSIRNCDMEAVVTSTEANGCLIDVQGNVTSTMQAFTIEGNYLGANSLYALCTVRVDRAADTMIRSNFVSPGSAHSYIFTANSLRSRFEFNSNDSVGSILDSSTTTSGTIYNTSTGVINNYGVAVSFPKVAVGSTDTTGSMINVKSLDATGGSGPAAWNGQWSTHGLATGPTGAALGIAVNSTSGVFVTALNPSIAYLHIIYDALDQVFKTSTGTRMTITDTSIVATVPITGTTLSTGGATPSTWTNGTGVPGANCNAGDLYSNRSGGVVTTLYVCTSANTWTAK